MGNAPMAVYLMLGSLGGNDGLSDFAGQLFHKMFELPIEDCLMKMGNDIVAFARLAKLGEGNSWVCH
ncbi:hypothetical protein RHGRI_011979 [Rhododendron griersonianum]|uniref:Uncharacterized protein n=1 Tax=Rhododendron griersonianum TaxID=479676 RepID=A0AAV6KPD0_9ERIC|nr:hypothetical protein RHGRI_011979 [Rhododendron griersonianum]